MRVVVVGASSGLGRCIAVHLGQKGDRVALLARRKDRLEAAAKEAGPGAVPIACDVRSTDSCRTAIDEVVGALGGIDALVFATGVGTLGRIEELDVDTWRQTLDTNVIGASLITTAALPHLKVTSGVAAYLSSVQAGHGPVWPGLSSYAVSKAALDRLVDAWRAEHPSVGFTRVTVGECGGGEGDAQSGFTTGWDADLAGELAPGWITKGLMSGLLMDVQDLLRVLDAVLPLGANASIPSVTVMPRHQT